MRERKTVASNNVGKLFNSSWITPGRSLSSIVQGHTESDSRKSSIVEEFLKLAILFKEPEQLTLEQEIEKFLSEYKKMQKNTAKSEFLRLLKKVNASYGP